MPIKLYIADDDKAILQMLIRIIKEHGLGEVVGHGADGAKAVEDILILKPNIVLIDLLMPKIDGVEAMLSAKAQGSEAAFIMISQVDHREMVTRAYAEGVEYYIKKPINVMEVVSVIGRVREKMQMTQLIQSYKLSSRGQQVPPLDLKIKHSESVEERQRLKRILAQLGILGEAGCQDLIDIVMWIREKDEEHHSKNYKLFEVYEYLVSQYESGHQTKVNIGTVEQRVRRAIKSALNHLASIGLEDYYDSVFTHYSSTLFDFSEVKREMDYERGKSRYSGKINAKKFVEGLIVQLEGEE